jgi:predicted nuclease of predicted toxin-antitoxin system
MKFKFNENVPEELGVLTTEAGHDVHTVLSEKLGGRNDPTIFAAASAEDRVLVTQDLDFSDVRQFAPGTHSGIILIRLATPSRRNLIERFAQLLAHPDLETWARCFVVATDMKLRVRRP